MKYLNRVINEATEQYKFLKHIKDPDGLLDADDKYASSDLVDIGGDDTTGEISRRIEKGLPSWEFIINIDSEKRIKDSMKEDKKLTAEIQKAFEDSEGSWSKFREEWVKEKGGELGETGSGNTYNEDNAYFWGGVFEWTEFKDVDGKDGAVIMFHRGGDVRGNYDSPVVYIGDFQDFFLSMSPDPEQEIAYLMGYDGDYKKLIADLNEWFSANPEATKDIEQQIRDYMMGGEKEMSQDELYTYMNDHDPYNGDLDYDAFKKAWESLKKDNYLMKATGDKFKWEV